MAHGFLPDGKLGVPGGIWKATEYGLQLNGSSSMAIGIILIMKATWLPIGRKSMVNGTISEIQEKQSMAGNTSTAVGIISTIPVQWYMTSGLVIIILDLPVLWQ